VAVSSEPASSSSRPRRALREILIYGLVSGLLIALLKVVEYRFLVVEHSMAIYGGLVAVLFAGVGIWLGVTLTRTPAPPPIPSPSPEPTAPVLQPLGPFTRDEARVSEFGLTPRELEILELIAEGLSTREIADKLCVSENTVKTHSSRVLAKLGAKRRTQAVQIGKASRLIP
jgi:DNA-binding CsgD family transcriptional regulator